MLEITVIQAIGPDKTIRAVKMVNSVGLDGQINRDELRYNSNTFYISILNSS